MQPLTSEQATLLLQLALASLENENPVTLRQIQAIPAGKGDYRPAPVSKSAEELAWHIVAVENMFLKSVVAGAFSYDFAKPENIKTTADMAAWYAETAKANRARLAQMTGSELTKIMDFRGFFQMPAVMFLQFAINHSIHHRGQLSVYLRPMGAKVPAIYGPSHDDDPTRRAAQA